MNGNKDWLCQHPSNSRHDRGGWIECDCGKRWSITPKNGSEENMAQDQAISIVAEQANDEGLWFEAKTVPEAYLQAALRRLHAAIEADTVFGKSATDEARIEAIRWVPMRAGDKPDGWSGVECLHSVLILGLHKAGYREMEMYDALENWLERIIAADPCTQEVAGLRAELAASRGREQGRQDIIRQLEARLDAAIRERDDARAEVERLRAISLCALGTLSDDGEDKDRTRLYLKQARVEPPRSSESEKP